MNILVLNGSPKGNASNTLRLTDSFLKGLQDAYSNKNIETSIDIVHINNLHIEACRGCFSCWNKTPGRCIVNDDMMSVLEKLRWADLTIWSFPLYYFNVPRPLKTLIDRQLPLSLPFMTERTDGAGHGNHPSRYDMSGKRTILISTCGFYTAEKNYDSVTGLFDHILAKEITRPCSAVKESFSVSPNSQNEPMPIFKLYIPPAKNMQQAQFNLTQFRHYLNHFMPRMFLNVWLMPAGELIRQLV